MTCRDQDIFHAKGSNHCGRYAILGRQTHISAWAYRSTGFNALREVGDRMAECAKLTDQDTVLRAQLAAETDALRHASNRCQAGFTAHIEQVLLIQTGAEHLTALVRR